MKSFNILTMAVAILIAASTFVSCKKDKDTPAPNSFMQGNWEGKYGYGNAEPDTYFALVINSNGTLQVKSGDKNDPYISSGTWTLEEDVFKVIYQSDDNEDLNLAAKLNEAKTELTGSWGFGKVDAGMGDFIVTKK